MSNQGDDCYFYYYSTCTKGDGCPFRHCEAAMGSEIVCSLWQENRCFRSVCKFRHMEIKKNRKEIACYWENQPGGCQKPHCAFHHEKPRVIDGLYVPPDKGGSVQKEKEEETPKDNQITPVPALISNATNPQLRGVIKAETQESVPSPTHPPVVINPVDDEDDEDDQFSEEGDESSGVSPRQPRSSSKDESLNFGIKTLEEIRLAKALKTNLQETDLHLTQGSNGFTSVKQSVSGTEYESEHVRACKLQRTSRGRISDRLGKMADREDVPVDDGLKLSRNLVKRLGGFVDDSTENRTSQKSLRPVHERLGITPDRVAPNSELNVSEDIRVKSLEEIRQEKAVKCQLHSKVSRTDTEVPESTLISYRVNKSVSDIHIKTFSEILHEKKQLKQEKSVSQKSTFTVERTEDSVNNVGSTAQEQEVRVKSLEEIRKEKATRLHAQVQETMNDKASQSSHVPINRRILCIKKNTSSNRSSEKKPEDSEKVNRVSESVVANGKNGSSSQIVMVKSFEEIMREKRLRQQQEEQQPPCASEKLSMVKPERDHRVVTPANIESLSQTKVSVRQRLSLKHGAPVSRPVETSQRKLSVNEDKVVSASPKKMKLSSVTPEEEESSLCLQDKKPQPESSVHKTPSSKAEELKVRPKLNVKPSVMNPAFQLTHGKKRKVLGNYCSAVAAVKPLNSVLVPEADLQCKRIATCSMVVGASTQESLDEQNALPSTSTSSPNEQPTVKRPSVKSQSVVRRASAGSARNAAGSCSMGDDFEDLLDEFTDDRLDEEIELDSGKGEDDLLLELSEMIDS